jgi:hypothetical protein
MHELKRQAGDLNGDAAAIGAMDQMVLGHSASQVVAPATSEVVPADWFRPSFFVIGPPRTGTSWLHKVLSPHTLLPSPAKETRFFDQHFHRGLKWYMAHYRNDDGKDRRRIGEIAPTYFASESACERISQTAPEAKIICIFRNPVERIVSLYRLKRAYGLIPWNFEQAVELDAELVETSRYASNLKMWRRAFGAENVLTGIFDDLREKPQAFLDTLLDFIEVPRFVLSEPQYASVHDSENMTHPRSYYRTRSAMKAADWFKARRLNHLIALFKRSPMLKFVLGGGEPFQQVPAEVFAKLSEAFRPEVEELEVLLQRDLSRWKFQGSV